jgi:predicted  nucleic acid-binding Zn-ribbon protein
MENKKENKNEKMTLEKLAGMVARGFARTDKRFDSLDTELHDVKSRLGKVEFQVDEVHDILKRFEENDILNLQKRVQILEKAVRALATSQTSK